jgi:hypothetical protein
MQGQKYNFCPNKELLYVISGHLQVAQYSIGTTSGPHNYKMGRALSPGPVWQIQSQSVNPSRFGIICGIALNSQIARSRCRNRMFAH